MKMIAVGDNVTDCYLDEKVFYPGGNAVNVAVGCKRDGFDEVAYIGVFGSDVNADHLKWALGREGIVFERSRTVLAPSGQPGVKLVDGDRVFVSGPKNTAQHILRLRLTPADLEYIAGFDVCHTSCFSNIEPELPVMQKTCDISFDFSEYRDSAYLGRVCPYIRFAFFSGSDMEREDIERLMDECHALGTEIVGVTLGKRGSLFSRRGERFEQGIVETEVVDTMGAGDSFIAGFLYGVLGGKSVPEAMRTGAENSAVTLGYSGAW